LELPTRHDRIRGRHVDDPAADQRSDDQLIENVAGGDSRALVTLFRRRRLELYRFALHMTGRQATAEDITQEVFMTVMRDAARFDGRRGSALSWLCGITRNLVRRRLERDRFLQPLPDEVETLPAPAVVADPLGDLARAERIALVRRAVMALPVRYREVVLLCDLQELSYNDAAAALDCAVGTVRSRLHRGRALLAEKMRDLEQREQALKVRNRRCFA
jgi:RNA polymerase sigma-70 factor (ECF subfamily)